ncbi:MAG: hypothetical protein AB1847_04980 [bacterium]
MFGRCIPDSSGKKDRDQPGARQVCLAVLALSGIFTFSCLFPSLSWAVGFVGVNPLLIDLELSTGKRGEFEMEVYSISNEDVPVHFSLFDVIQKEDGSTEFSDIGSNRYSCTPWIKLEKSDLTIPAGESVIVKGEITVPLAHAGSRLAAIMVEPCRGQKEAGIIVKLRYAVILRLKITDRPAMEEARLDRFGKKKLADGTPALEAVLFNKSETDYKVKGSVLIQDGSGKIFTELNLTTDSLERKKKEGKKEEKEKKKGTAATTGGEEDQRIYPGARVAFWAGLDKPVPPGDYVAILNMRYGQRSLTAKENISFTEEDIAPIARKSAQGVSFEIKPSYLEVKGQPAGIRTAVFTIINLVDEPQKVSLSIKDIEYDPNGQVLVKDPGTTPYSANGWLQLERSEYEIGPRLSQSVSMRVEVPASIVQVGNRYGQVVVEKSYQGGFETAHGEKGRMEVGVILPGKVEPAFEVKCLKRLEKDKGFGELVAEVRNNGPVHVIPKGRVIIKDVYDNKVDEVELNLIVRALLPYSEGRMRGEIKKKLIPGEYIAIAEIDYGGKEKATSKITFKKQPRS